ncbi:hypothetical protein WKK05_02345 [Nostoc sp. UHCC 0302]|uniref:ISAzo13-like element transposase-related protein n=1 Tax=Nostoc sp. UHCC 0302 TaxID=3134896 RepID=UPI00311CD713
MVISTIDRAAKFDQITESWRSRLMNGRKVVIHLIGNTTTYKRLTIKAQEDENKYQTGNKVTNKELSNIYRNKSDFHGDYNY